MTARQWEGAEVGNTTGGAAPSDALVLFGVTGDLVHKMIFPALYAMAKRGVLNVPVVGVASSPWSLEQLIFTRSGCWTPWPSVTRPGTTSWWRTS